jgi:hypothetical protein
VDTDVDWGRMDLQSSEARVTDTLTDGRADFFFSRQPSTQYQTSSMPYNAIQLLSGQQSCSSTPSPIHRTRFVPTPWSALHHP